VICGVVAGVVTWVVVDRLGVEIDEYLNRDQMREDIMRAIRAGVPEIAAALKERQNSVIDASVGAIEAEIERRFSPYRDGL
jgi:hypothetical protein